MTAQTTQPYRCRYETLPVSLSDRARAVGWEILGVAEPGDHRTVLRAQRFDHWVRARRPVVSWETEPADPLAPNVAPTQAYA